MKLVLMPSAWLVILALEGVSTARALEPDVEAPQTVELQTPTEATNEATNEATIETGSSTTTESDPVEPPASAPAPIPETTPTTEPTPAPTPAPAPASESTPRPHPRLMLAGGPIVGPHAIGNEQCNTELARCETKGSFLGLGAQVELRARLWRSIYVHGRGLAVGNVSPNSRIYKGLWGLGAGLGLYGRRAFGRAEYLFVDAFGDNRFEPPFYEGKVASDEWGHHAGMVSVGFRQPLPRGLAVELWGGLVIGPRSVRKIPQEVPDERALTTFLVGLNLSWDALP